jgi:hypothetical protein
MADRFELYRLSLLPRAQGILFEDAESRFTREQWLRKVFSEEQPFIHHGSDFHYVPSPSNSGDEPVIGRVGRKVFREENKPPSEGLEDVTHEAWLASVLVSLPVNFEYQR